MARGSMVVCVAMLMGLMGPSLAPQTAHGSAPDLIGFGPRGPAMAGALTAAAIGGEATYYNPGALAFERDISVSFGFQMTHFQLELDGEAYSAPDAPSLHIGMSLPLPFGGVMKDRLTVSLGLLIPQESILLAHLPRPGEPGFPLVESRAQTVSIMAALAVRITDWLGIGGGFIALASLFGEVEMGPNATGRLSSEVRNAVLADFAPIVGVQLHPTKWLSIGITYRAESRADFNFPMTADLGDALPIPLPEFTLSGTAQFDPHQLSVGIAGRPVPGLLLALDAVWKHWSTFPNPVAYTATPDGFPPQPEPEFSDSFVLRLGAEYTAHATLTEPDEEGAVHTLHITPRLGMAYAMSPAPEQVGFHNLLDSDRVIVGAGLGLRWRMLTLHLLGQVQVATPRTHTKTEPPFLEDHPGYPSITHSGLILHWGLGLEVAL